MIMYWKDLKAGDILEFNPKFLESDIAKLPCFSDVKVKAPEFFAITDMEITNDTVQLMFTWWHINWSICINNGALWNRPDGPSVFRIVSLLEDD